MKLYKFLLGMVLFSAFSAFAQYDSWKPKSKDEFDTAVETLNNSNISAEQPEKEVNDKSAPAEESKPEAKPDAKSESKPEAKTYKNLKSTPAKHPDGKVAKFESVIVFSCANLGKKRFLFNKKQSDFCHIKDVKVAAKIAEKIGTDPFKKKFATFEACAESADSQKACDPNLVRNF